MDIVKIILELGFPIACVLVMAVFIHELYKDSVAREDNLNKQIKESQEINAKFAEVLTKYDSKLDSINDKLDEIAQDVIILTDRLD